jgi:hypothetical protein
MHGNSNIKKKAFTKFHEVYVVASGQFLTGYIWSKGLFLSEIRICSVNLWSPEESLMRQLWKQENLPWLYVEELVKMFRNRRRKVRCCITKWRDAVITAVTSVAEHLAGHL